MKRNKSICTLASSLILVSGSFTTVSASQDGLNKIEPNTIDTADLLLSQPSDNILTAGFWDVFNDVKEGVDDVLDIVEQEKVREEKREKREIAEQQRQIRLEERKRRQEELAQARAAAKEQEIQEAVRRRAYFESLSPSEQQAYIEKQQQIRQQQVAAQLLLMGLVLDGWISGGMSNNSQPSNDRNIPIENNTSTQNNSRPNPVKPIDPFYGDCHSPMGC